MRCFHFEFQLISRIYREIMSIYVEEGAEAPANGRGMAGAGRGIGRGKSANFVFISGPRPTPARPGHSIENADFFDFNAYYWNSTLVLRKMKPEMKKPQYLEKIVQETTVFVFVKEIHRLFSLYLQMFTASFYFKGAWIMSKQLNET